MKLSKISILALITVILVIASCGGPKKCNGKRGTRVDMGTM